MSQRWVPAFRGSAAKSHWYFSDHEFGCTNVGIQIEICWGCKNEEICYQDNQGDFVFAVEEKNTVLGTQNVLVRIPVTVLEVGQSQTSIEGAISPEDSIVVQSTRSPEAGSKVRVKNENA